MEDEEEKMNSSKSVSSDDSSLKDFYEDVPETDSSGEWDKISRKNASKQGGLRNSKSEISNGFETEGRENEDVTIKKEYEGDKSESVDCDIVYEDVQNHDYVDKLKLLVTFDGHQNGESPKVYDGDLDFEDYVVDMLGKENNEAEARLAARRQARVEAREIRLRELERQQKEQEENADKVFDMSDNLLRSARVAPLSLLNSKDRPPTVNSYHSSRRSSEDSLEDGSYSLRDIKMELKEMDEKFRKAMIANAQLDNEKSELTYQVELLKDKLEDLEETHAQLTRENREKCREHEQLKRVAVKLKEELAFYKSQLEERDKLIADYGLVIVGGESEDGGSSERILVSTETAGLLQEAGNGSLDVRLKKFAEERNELLDEVRHLKLELEEERSKKRSDSRIGYGSLTNGPLDEETSKLLSDYRFKLQKAEQDVSTLQANVARLESQVIRYKSAAESSEKAEDELKIEKRKLQRENRESIARIEELETANSHLQKRMDKLKNAKSTLLKEL